MTNHPKAISLEDQCLQAARWILHAFNMFCNLGEVIKVTLLLKEEDAENTDEDNSEVSKRCKSFSKEYGTTQDWYQCMYHYIEDHAPYAIKLMKDKKQPNQFDALISEVIGMYAMLYPDKKSLERPLGSNESHSRMGFNHPKLACLLCPVKHLSSFLDNPTEMQKQLQDGHMTTVSANWPAFLYCGNIPGEDFNPVRFNKGFLHGFVLIQVLKHIFISPSSALSNGKLKSTHPRNGKLHGMCEVTAEHIAYSAVHACYSLTLHEKWKQHDSIFDYADFYYRILNFLTCKANKKWHQSLYSYLNKELFGDE
ncbi:hypothetical protein EDC04DRAFT_2600026 [Pisolithus marmoratus]|nr:hypothetical protein EDC04DRAFT_2600026 [Pisolithus marmoratus]